MGSRPRKLVGHSVIGFSVDTLALDQLLSVAGIILRNSAFNDVDGD